MLYMLYIYILCVVYAVFVVYGIYVLYVLCVVYVVNVGYVVLSDPGSMHFSHIIEQSPRDWETTMR